VREKCLYKALLLQYKFLASSETEIGPLPEGVLSREARKKAFEHVCHG